MPSPNPTWLFAALWLPCCGASEPVTPEPSSARPLVEVLRELARSPSLQRRCTEDLGPAADESVCELWALHRFLTSSRVGDGVAGGAFGLPYFWLVGTEARRGIVHVESGAPLTEQEATEERLPTRYLGDLAHDEPAWRHPDFPELGAFASFGWCSEREMAICAIAEAWGYPARVVVAEGYGVGNHVNTEVLIQSAATQVVVMDTTFGLLAQRTEAEAPPLATWRADARLDRIDEEHADNRIYSAHYNAVCHESVAEVRAITVGPAGAARLQRQATW